MQKNYLITGGAGFIGSNCVARLLERGEQVTIYDNLSRMGGTRNIEWLQTSFGKGSFQMVVGDLRDAALLATSAKDADVIIHLAGQVAVTTSLLHPREDFEDNALGTFGRNPIVIYASTNKVYGGMDDILIVEDETRYAYADRPYGIPETYPLDFYSPYGCSKGTGDQYVRDYARIYDLPTVVFRQSTIYGPRQFGIEDQGWMAWFIIAALLEQPIKIYGNGKQIRDMLYVEDLLAAYDAAIENIDSAAGEVFNIGGGPGNTISIWTEFGPVLETMLGREVPITRGDWRPGDQKVFIADIRKSARMLAWTPKVDLSAGMRKLYTWIADNQALFR